MSTDTNEPTLSNDERHTLAGVLDEVIPPSSEGRLPGAGEIDLATYVEETLRQTPDIAPVILQGLSAIAERARSRGGERFIALSDQDKLEVLQEIESAEPAFLPTLTLYTYMGYYQNGRVLAALGLEPRPPHPEGYDVGENDLTLLDEVRRRPKLYRA